MSEQPQEVDPPQDDPETTQQGTVPPYDGRSEGNGGAAAGTARAMGSEEPLHEPQPRPVRISRETPTSPTCRPRGPAKARAAAARTS